MFSYIPCDAEWTASYPNTSSRSRRYEELGMLCDWREINGGATEVGRTAALTDRTRWACSSLAYNPPRLASNAFYNLLDTPMRIDELPRQVVRPTSKPVLPPNEDNVMFGIDQGAIQEADERVKESRNIKESYSCKAASSTMLPVADYRHNIRECIKNMILLEDHLCHPEKRCTDCCQKHFLFLEGLAEEARTLDTSGQMSDDVFDLPSFYRTTASEWASIDPASKTAGDEYSSIMQKLRSKRKAIQDGYFAIGSGGACKNGVCYNA